MTAEPVEGNPLEHPVHELNVEEAHALLDAEARHHLGISGEELVRRYDAGEVDVDDPDRHDALIALEMLLPFARAGR